MCTEIRYIFSKRNTHNDVSIIALSIEGSDTTRKI